ncbi:hypothetical protein DFH07DRAFT_959121 [Mycena maculata]|uniref:Uncharacterized protein n=1 Tax=Mycena maculata TaxID=230809 RepID=A0AAD7J3Q2_9AGAR|nr:hypothetical protein DFH07DRAFT_959121 [Mycena maculata]
MSGQHNAEAGPSTPLFLKPNGPPIPKPRLASTHDLLARFRLLPAYDKYVRPPADDPSETQDNGKGKAREQNSPAPQTPGEQDPDDDDPATAKGEKKKKNTYKHLIKGIPGKHSMRKDDFLMKVMEVPPKQRMQITPFDLKTQREAFSVSLDGIKGWNLTVLVPESAQAREDRKKRKELRRLAKVQAQLHAQAAAGSPAPSSASAPAPGTPRVGTPRPAVGTPTMPRLGSARPTVPPVVVPGRVGTPQRGPGTGTPTSATPRTGTPHPLSAAPLSAVDRGIKRERDDGHGFGQNGQPPMPIQVQNGQTPVIAAARAGIPGARPRPVKKQRVDMQGQAREVQQQPTPQGV